MEMIARPRFGFALLVVGILLAAGCSSNQYIEVRKIPRNPLADQLQLLSRGGPRPTERTLTLLRRFALRDVYERDAAKAIEQLHLQVDEEPTPEKLYALAELSYVEGKRAETRGKKSEALDHYGASVANAYLYLFDPYFNHVRNQYDPQFRQACDLYNGSLEAALRLVNSSGRLRPGETVGIETGGHQYDVTVMVRGPWHAEDFERLEFVSDYEMKGLNNQHHTYGLGVPLIAVRKQHPHESPAEAYYPPGLSFPVTAFLRVVPDATDSTTHCVLELHDPLLSCKLPIADKAVPLETDLSTPLAYFLDHPELNESKYVGTLGLLNPMATQRATGLYMLEPYDPNRIPVIMVHGLWSSPLTWMEMFNDLRSFPEIRRQYQFWFYLYPTGQPFWISATQMRRDLQQVRNVLDPGHRTPTLNQTVLVGHSMGGLVSRLQTLDSGDDFWQTVSDKPLDEINAPDEVRAQLAETLYFQPNPSVRRVITIGTPHRGSEFSNDYTRWAGRKLIRLPDMLVKSAQRLVLDNPDAFRNSELMTITTSIDSLSPDSPILPVMLQAKRAPWVRYHNIVGVIPQETLLGRLAGKGDGVVEYSSAHLEDVDSEIEVQADHVTVHQHPRSILEVRRILLQHGNQFRDELARATGPVRMTIPAGYRAPVVRPQSPGGGSPGGIPLAPQPWPAARFNTPPGGPVAPVQPLPQP